MYATPRGNLLFDTTYLSTFWTLIFYFYLSSFKIRHKIATSTSERITPAANSGLPYLDSVFSCAFNGRTYFLYPLYDSVSMTSHFSTPSGCKNQKNHPSSSTRRKIVKRKELVSVRMDYFDFTPVTSYLLIRLLTHKVLSDSLLDADDRPWPVSVENSRVYFNIKYRYTIGLNAYSSWCERDVLIPFPFRSTEYRPRR